MAVIRPTHPKAVLVNPSAPIYKPSALPIPTRVYQRIGNDLGPPYSGIQRVTAHTDLDSASSIAYLVVDGTIVSTLLGSPPYVFNWDPTGLTGNHTVAVYVGALDAESTGYWAGGPTTINFYTYPNKGVHFGGASNDAAELANALFAPTTSGFTVAFWFRVTADTGVEVLASLNSNGTAGWLAQWIGNPTNAARFAVINNGSTLFASPTLSAAVGGWHLFVGANANTALDINNTVYISLDGAAKTWSGNATAGPFNTGTNKFAVGYNALAVTNWATADIDEVMYWNRVLTDTEIALIYNAGIGINYHDLSNNSALSSLLTNLVVCLDCDDTGGQNLVDASNNGLNLLGKNGTSTYTSVSGIR